MRFSDFCIHFLVSNCFLTVFVGMILVIKKILHRTVSARTQYNFGFILLGLLTVPFLPVKPMGFLQLFSWMQHFYQTPDTVTNITNQTTAVSTTTAAINWADDFSVSINRTFPSSLGLLLFFIWLIGILIMLILVMESQIRLYSLKQSALPLQNAQIRLLFEECKQHLQINHSIPIYSTAFIKSPMMVGVIRPQIYIPIHLISDFPSEDIRYMLLHELQHYKHKDTFTNYLITLAGILYWFHPAVTYALKTMRIDQEIACDSSVLEMLNKAEYKKYGNTLINFAEKISVIPFPFASGIGGTGIQIERRIMNIATYQSNSFGKRIRSICAYILIAAILLGLAPILSTHAVEQEHYQMPKQEKNISYIDLSEWFADYHGSFVLYDTSNHSWQIYNKENATLRTAPNSTYKIYNALFALESGIITPNRSEMQWNGEIYPFDAWNSNQNLNSAMKSSVNWYFQNLDKKMGKTKVQHYLKNIGYGNESIHGDFSTYWMESSLKISPVEQVELLKNLYDYELPFASEHINTVKNSLCLSHSSKGTLYGKTGTGQINNQDINGWFIGWVENSNNTYIFAANIQSDSHATGKKASEITLSILSSFHIWS